VKPSGGVANDKAFREWWAAYLRHGASPGAAVALTKLSSQMDVRRALPSIRIPTLVIHRVGDLCEKVEGGRYLASNIPGAKLVEAPGDDHLAWIGPQDEVLDPVEAFLTDLQSVPIPDRVLATGEVLVSSTVKDLVAGSGIRFEDRGVHGLKEAPGEWRFLAVEAEPSTS